MPHAATPEDDKVLAAGPLRVRFIRTGDRYAHVIEHEAESRWVELMRSVEGDHASAWPASPPLQYVEINARSADSTALLVGMSGKSHWSMSMTLNGAARRIECDVACRLREPAGWLGSTYQTPGPMGRCGAKARGVCGNLLLEVSAVPVEIELRTGGSSENQMLIVPTLNLSQDPQTVRWIYTVMVSDC